MKIDKIAQLFNFVFYLIVAIALYMLYHQIFPTQVATPNKPSPKRLVVEHYAVLPASLALQTDQPDPRRKNPK